MPRGRLRFKETEIARLVRATEKAGVPVGRVIVDQDGSIVVVAASEPDDEHDLAHQAALKNLRAA